MHIASTMTEGYDLFGFCLFLYLCLFGVASAAFPLRLCLGEPLLLLLLGFGSLLSLCFCLCILHAGAQLHKRAVVLRTQQCLLLIPSQF